MLRGGASRAPKDGLCFLASEGAGHAPRRMRQLVITCRVNVGAAADLYRMKSDEG